MIIAFELFMPGVNTWNGHWGGEGKYYAKAVNIGRSTEKQELGEEILSIGSFDYDFGDGWMMSISVREVDGKEASKIRRKSDGFCGYDWAVDSIIENLDIRTTD